MNHTPVLIDEIIEVISKSQKNNEDKGFFAIDCTFGAGGYSSRILENFPHLSVIGIDRDKNVLKFAEELKKKYGERFTFVNDKFSNIVRIVDSLRIDFSKIKYVIYDFGISSMQIDSDRGFSFMRNENLNMGMGINDLTALDVVNTYSEEDLADIIYYFSDEEKARQIAKSICFSRKSKKIETTDELSEIIGKIVKHDRINPSTRTFQAIRMEVNNELGEISESLVSISEKLAKNALIIGVTFHSVEDLIVKSVFKYLCGKNIILNNIPKVFFKYFKDLENESQNNFIIKGKKKFQSFQKEIIIPSESEISKNPRARSAKMRVVALI